MTWPSGTPAAEQLRQKSDAWAAETAPIPTTTRVRRCWHRGWKGELWRWALVGVLFAMVALPLLSASLLAAVYWQARRDESRPVDAIVVLGAAQYNGRPSPVLRARLDEAAAAYDSGFAPVVVVTGGKQPGDNFTEAETSRNYLIDRGVPADAILLENRGNTTWQSMQGVARLLDARGLHSVLLVSDGFHLLRSKIMARHLGLAAYGRPATDSPIARWSGNELDYAVREAAGIAGFGLGYRG